MSDCNTTLDGINADALPPQPIIPPIVPAIDVELVDKGVAIGVDCAGADLPPVPIIGAVQTVPHPTAVQLVKLCPDTKAPTVVTACNAAGETVLVQYDATTVPPTELSRTNLLTGLAEPAGTLTECDSDEIELAPLKACLDGVEIIGVAVITDAASQVVTGELWRDPSGTWGALPAGAVVGACASASVAKVFSVSTSICVGGVAGLMREYTIGNEPPVKEYTLDALLWTTTEPVGFTLGACPAATMECVVEGELNYVTDGVFDNTGGAGRILFDWVQVPAPFATGSVTASGGKATWPAAGAYATSISQTLGGVTTGPLTVGVDYKLQFEVSGYSSGFMSVLVGGVALPIAVNANGVWEVTFTATSPTPELKFSTSFFASPFQLDNISIKGQVSELVPVSALSTCTIAELAAQTEAQTAAIVAALAAILASQSLEADRIDWCIDGVNLSQWVVMANGIPTGASTWTDSSGAVVPAPNLTGAGVSKGACSVEFSPFTLC